MAKKLSARRRSTRAVLPAVLVNMALLVGVFATAAPAPAAAAVRRPPVPAPGPIISTVAGTGCCGLFGDTERADGGPATQAKLSAPQGVAVDAAGNLYIADTADNRIRKVDTSGIITTFAGGGSPADGLGDGLPATQASLALPFDVAVDAEGNVYIADAADYRIRKVDPSGIITTVAGDGTAGFSGDGGPATAAQLSNPVGLDVDVEGNLYIVDQSNSRVRRVDADTGIITTVAGGGAPADGVGDGLVATEAQLNSPSDVAVDAQGNLYIADQGNNRVRRVDADTGIITTVAGDGTAGFSGDGGPATAAQLAFPSGVAIDHSGNLYISDTVNNRVRKVDPAGTITTFAGTGDCSGQLGDGGPATKGEVCQPARLAVDAAGNLFIADNQYHRIRVVGVLSVVKSDTPDPVPAGGALTYTVSVLNFSAVTAKSVTVTDTLPPGVTFVSARARGTCTQASGTVTCTVGDVAPGTVVSLQIKVTAPAEDTVISNTATIQADHPDQVVVDDTSTEETIVGAARLGLTKVPSGDPVPVNAKLSYLLTVSNGLPTTATGVVLTDQLPPELSFVSARPSQGSCSQAAGTVTCQLGDIAYQKTAIVTIVVTPTTPGTFINTAEVRSNQTPDPATATATARVSAADCGKAITKSTVLTKDIGPCGLGDGVIVAADGVTLDLNGHRIFGFAGPGDGAAGIRVPNHRQVTIRNGTVSGFDAGVVIGGGGSNTVSGMTVRDNVGPDDAFTAELGDGIFVLDSPSNLIIDNLVTNNGIFDGIGVLGGASDDNRIEGNTVENNVGPSDGGPAGQGIIVNSFTGDFDGEIITGTKTIDNVVRGNASAGLSNFNNVDGEILRNVVEDNGLTNAAGNGIGVQLGPGAEATATRVLVQDNQVHGNGWDGIQIADRATENRIIDNDAADNGLAFDGIYAGLFFFDLHDNNSDPETGELDCDANVWSGNTWGSAFYSPECVTNGGSGPPLPPQPASSSQPSVARDNQSATGAPASDFPPTRKSP
ncbi:MAG: right-handed parallel beta-helix repeat-containing protein [Acidimicrobiales bacterium]